jgi:hypothetical protein
MVRLGNAFLVIAIGLSLWGCGGGVQFDSEAEELASSGGDPACGRFVRSWGDQLNSQESAGGNLAPQDEVPQIQPPNRVAIRPAGLSGVVGRNVGTGGQFGWRVNWSRRSSDHRPRFMTILPCSAEVHPCHRVIPSQRCS